MKVEVDESVLDKMLDEHIKGIVAENTRLKKRVATLEERNKKLNTEKKNNKEADKKLRDTISGTIGCLESALYALDGEMGVSADVLDHW